jgi:hypothetical protein
MSADATDPAAYLAGLIAETRESGTPVSPELEALLQRRMARGESPTGTPRCSGGSAWSTLVSLWLIGKEGRRVHRKGRGRR